MGNKEGYQKTTLRPDQLPVVRRAGREPQLIQVDQQTLAHAANTAFKKVAEHGAYPSGGRHTPEFQADIETLLGRQITRKGLLRTIGTLAGGATVLATVLETRNLLREVENEQERNVAISQAIDAFNRVEHPERYPGQVPPRFYEKVTIKPAERNEKNVPVKVRDIPRQNYKGTNDEVSYIQVSRESTIKNVVTVVGTAPTGVGEFASSWLAFRVGDIEGEFVDKKGNVIPQIDLDKIVFIYDPLTTHTK